MSGRTIATRQPARLRAFKPLPWAVESGGESGGLDVFDCGRHALPDVHVWSMRRAGRLDGAPLIRRDRRGLQHGSRLVLRPAGTPGGLDARKYEGSRLNGRERQRQELVFKERERLDTLGRGQFVD
jgi:hypothetical protein